ncbi:MAG: hypothetical protein HY231_20075 [Acidobacteria bacterium]|nr:hypothetical protein [Acidobacteriota bacterium]
MMKKSCLTALLLLFCSVGFAIHTPNHNTVYAAPAPVAGTAVVGATDILLLTCMDYRLTDDITRYMDHEGLSKKYDHIVLAGASLGASTAKFPSWGKTFWEHLQVAIDLHHIHKVMILDHKDCGAYKVILGEDAVKTPELELKAHTAQLNNLKKQISAQYPKLEVEMLLMSLNGDVAEIH